MRCYKIFYDNAFINHANSNIYVSTNNIKQSSKNQVIGARNRWA